MGLLGGVLIALSIAGYRYYSGKENTKNHQSIIEQGNNIKQKVDSSTNDIIKGQNKISNEIDDLNKKTEQIVSNADPNTNIIPNEEFFITVNKFGSPIDNIDHLYLETILSNDGSKSVIVSDVQLIFSPVDNYNGTIVYTKQRKSITIKSNNSISHIFFFGKNKDDLILASSNFSGFPFKISLKLTLSSLKSDSYYYIIPLINNFKVIYPFEGYAYTKGVALPVNIQLLPFEADAKHIGEKHKIN